MLKGILNLLGFALKFISDLVKYVTSIYKFVCPKKNYNYSH